MAMLPGVAFRVPAQKKKKGVGVAAEAVPGTVVVGENYFPGGTPRGYSNPAYSFTPNPKNNPMGLPLNGEGKPTTPNTPEYDPYNPTKPLDYHDTVLYDYPGKYVGVMPGAAVGIYDKYGNYLGIRGVQNHKANTDKALNSFAGADYAIVLSAQKALSDAGILSSSSYTPGRWDAATKSAMYVAMQEANRAGVSWQNYLRFQIEGSQDGTGTGPGGRGGGGGPVTTVQTIFSQTTKNRARLMIDQAVQEALGRAPTKAETRQFIKELRAAEEANPTVVTTTSDPSTGQTTQRTEPGLEADAWLADTYIEDVKPGKQDRYKRAQYENLLMTMMSDGSL